MTTSIHDMVDGVTIWRARPDCNGNSRYIVAASDVLTPSERVEYTSSEEGALRLAKVAAQRLHGRVYKGGYFGGGVIFKASEGAAVRVREALRKAKSEAGE